MSHQTVIHPHMISILYYYNVMQIKDGQECNTKSSILYFSTSHFYTKMKGYAKSTRKWPRQNNMYWLYIYIYIYVIYKSSMAVVLLATGTAYPLRAPGFSWILVDFLLLLYLVFCVVFLCFVCLRPVSCVSIFPSVYWLSILDCHFGFL